LLVATVPAATDRSRLNRHGRTRMWRAPYWHRASRVPGPDAGLWRGAPAANSFFLCSVLQSGTHALGNWPINSSSAFLQ
jgi:hypothetical protein